jgi:predicted GNAT family acetyltransferase
MNVTRYETADAFLEVAHPLLLAAEAENNLLLGIAQGLARNPAAATNAYLATAGNDAGILACAVHVPPFKLVITRADREPVVALARDGFDAIPRLDGVTGPSRSTGEFALTWSTLSGIEPKLATRLRIHEARKVVDSGFPPPAGHFRTAAEADIPLLTEWTRVFVSDARITEPVDASRVVQDAVKRGRLHVWEDGAPVSMAAWAGKTTNGVRINCVYTPAGLRGKGYGTACVGALTAQQLERGNAFCWLYTDVSSTASPNVFNRIGYSPVADVSEYSLK